MSTNTPPVGVATKSGLLAALLQFGAAVACYIADGPTEVVLGALGTSGLTLITVLRGRYAQALASKTLGAQFAAQFAPRRMHGAAVSSPGFASASGAFQLAGDEPADELADEEPGDPDGLPHLPTTETPRARDHNDSVHGR